MVCFSSLFWQAMTPGGVAIDLAVIASAGSTETGDEWTVIFI